MKFTRTLLVVFFLVSVFNGCINQEDDYESLETEIQPELSEDGFIDLVNNILVEEVSLDMFEMHNGRYIYIRNTFDHDQREINIRIARYPTEVHISVSPDHFKKGSPLPNPYPQKIYVKGLFTFQIESQANLTPPSDFKTTRTYNILVMEYKGWLDVSRGYVSVHFKNIGGLSPTPTPPGPIPFISYVLYCGFIAIFVLVIVLTGYGIIVLRRRKKL
ncbi:MAG: hypothetical protein AYK18_18120 [Theionarchaea archaeon DG-70]|nr:MAG: hypothetical protein AYK18_18120 [Theionarchaea archaeon DG-70]